MSLLEMGMMSVARLGSAATASAPAPPQYAAWPALIGAEMMVNGDCSSGAGWGLGTGVTIALGKMAMAAANDRTLNDGVSSDGTLIEGAVYRNVFTIDSATLGAVQLGMGTALGTIRSTPGTFSQDIVATDVADEGGWGLNATTATMQLDNFSVKSVGLLGVAGDWALAGVSFGSSIFGALHWEDGGTSQTATLTGAALTAFDAAVSSAAACSVTVTIAEYVAGSIEIRMKGGSWVNMVANADGNFTKTITSGVGSGFEIRGEAGDATTLSLTRVQVALA